MHRLNNTKAQTVANTVVAGAAKGASENAAPEEEASTCSDHVAVKHWYQYKTALESKKLHVSDITGDVLMIRCIMLR